MLFLDYRNWILFATAAFFLVITPAQAETNIMFVLDVSGSMAQKIGSETKMTIAKRAFGKLADNLPAKANTGLYVYGHHGTKDCTAIENMVPLGADNGAKMKLAVGELQPLKGATPLTNALYLGAKSLIEEGKGDRALVLISDGKETCGDDPVAFMTKFADSMPADQIVKFYVIGLAVDAESKAQLEKIAQIGGGAYFEAGNETELTKALTAVANKLVKTPIFEDDFSGPFLNEAWQILQDDPDTRILDEGKFSVITGYGLFGDESVPNLLSYNARIMEESYDISLKVTIEAQVADYDRFLSWGHVEFGLRMEKSANDDLQLVVALVSMPGFGPSAQGFFGKTESGEYGNSKNDFLSEPVDGPASFYLRLEKRGFRYTGYASANNEDWVELGTQLLIGKNFKPQLFAVRGEDFNELLVSFDDFKILRVEDE